MLTVMGRGFVSARAAVRTAIRRCECRADGENKDGWGQRGPCPLPNEYIPHVSARSQTQHVTEDSSHCIAAEISLPK